MVETRSSKAVAIMTTIWLIASIAVLALATAGTDEPQPRGCRGGGSPSPSGSGSPTASGGGPVATVTGIVGSLLPGSQSPSPSPSGTRSPSPSASPTGTNAPDDFPDEVPVVVEQRITCKSTISIEYRTSNRKFAGRVGSGEPMCRRARDVQVRKVRKGADQLVGRAVTNHKGRYQVPDPRANGRYYAKVSKATVENEDGNTVTCQAARSETIRV